MIDLVKLYLPLILRGTAVTASVAVLSLSGSLAVGLLGAFLSLTGGPVSRRIVNAYTTLIRGVPDLVLMLLFYFGGQMFVNQIGTVTGLWNFVEVSAFGAGTVSIAIIFGAYMIETFRGAALAVPKGQIEAGLAYGLSRRRLFTRIIWPQLLGYALPGIGNNWQILMKTTALVSVIGLQDMVYNSFQAGRTSRHMFVFMGVAMGLYMVITVISGIVFHFLTKRFGPRERAR
ncbi:amine acid ABC transporter, permease protein, 3-TM region, His/Glu/Gln/Arg/opine family [Rhizobium leguminosarum bv. trifolii WSM597]|uniref:Amine acid ABC transporter, permease protein, 3-TM region, His/Glu/Gln/Arg/opine family n=1 Tax=Rhizobium leguminosarum bv. trifolii WSM597 TaxID=754764 RepID=J0H9E9_RHILT|nr:ABC transporter permease subunit [Rhizobium leguminosarum]EJB07020.1 amine acid ABC transporter, permease protein, 3-TM region, His/Glu/Gln/Arg/opine family [Rhizobium leguminosarum bv. trifolii WSM597]